MVRGPMIADVTAGLLTTKATAQLDQGQAGVPGDVGELLGGFELTLVLGQRHVEPSGESLAGR
jgi:hypothetical protein